jgi:hypothetical protein
MTRFVKLFYQIKNKLIIRLPQDQRQDFERELITENFSRLRFVSIVLFIIEAVLIIPENHPAQRYIMAAFLAANLILIPLIFLTSRRCYTVRIASAKIVMLSYTVVALLLGAGQALVVVRDMDITHVYLMSVFGIAMFLFIRPLPSALLFASVYVCFALALPHFGVPKDTLAAIRTNTLIFNLFAWILGQISLGHRMSVFANRKQLNEQNRCLKNWRSGTR